MQVTPGPTSIPVTPALLPQDTVARGLPQIQAQAASPIIQRAVDPSRSSDRGGKNRSNTDRGKGGGRDGERGNSVNIRV